MNTIYCLFPKCNKGKVKLKTLHAGQLMLTPLKQVICEVASAFAILYNLCFLVSLADLFWNYYGIIIFFGLINTCTVDISQIS